MSLIDKSRFESRGGNGCGSSDYRLQRTTCCGSFAVEDVELQDLYIDPDDLRKTMMLLYDPGADAPPSCPFCNAEDWDMIEVSDPAAVPLAWQWAVARGMPAASFKRA